MFKKPEKSKESGLRSRLELLGPSADSANSRDNINGDQAAKRSKISVALDDADDATEETSILNEGALVSKIMCTGSLLQLPQNTHDLKPFLFLTDKQSSANFVKRNRNFRGHGEETPSHPGGVNPRAAADIAERNRRRDREKHISTKDGRERDREGGPGHFRDRYSSRESSNLGSASDDRRNNSRQRPEKRYREGRRDDDRENSRGGSQSSYAERPRSTNDRRDREPSGWRSSNRRESSIRIHSSRRESRMEDYGHGRDSAWDYGNSPMVTPVRPSGRPASERRPTSNLDRSSNSKVRKESRVRFVSQESTPMRTPLRSSGRATDSSIRSGACLFRSSHSSFCIKLY